MIQTATITGVFFAPGGAPVTDADVFIIPRQKFITSTAGAPLVPRPLAGLRTNGTGQIGWSDGTTFTPGVALAIGQYSLTVRKGDIAHNGVLTVDAGMAAAPVPVDLAVALQPAPEPELVSMVIMARDTVLQTAQQVSDDVATIQGFVPVVVTLVGLTTTTATFEVQSLP
jgi:hypothetical protein